MALSEREVRPELLDELPADDPHAVRSRGDLRRINAIMFQSRIMAGLLTEGAPEPPERMLEIGAGDGAFSLAVARRLAPRWPKVELVLLDRQDILPAARRQAFERLGWRVGSVQADAFDWLAGPKGGGLDVVMANLFLHHFEAPALRELLGLCGRAAPALAATEPLRAPLPHALSRLLWVVGANDVTRHDATVSVRAGFAGQELSQLWPHERGWCLAERRAGIFTHAFRATRVPGGTP